MQKTYSLIAKSKFSKNDRVRFSHDGTNYIGVITKMLKAHANITLIDTTSVPEKLIEDATYRVTYRALQKDT